MEVDDHGRTKDQYKNPVNFRPAVKCVAGNPHVYYPVKHPEENRSGYHTERCFLCGHERCFDTSD